MRAASDIAMARANKRMASLPPHRFIQSVLCGAAGAAAAALFDHLVRAGAPRSSISLTFGTRRGAFRTVGTPYGQNIRPKLKSRLGNHRNSPCFSLLRKLSLPAL